MGDQQDGAGILAEIILEPEERFQIQMVRRFVQHQQVRLLGQQPRQMRAHHPAAAQLARGAVEIRLLETQAGENLLGLGHELAVVLVIVRHGDVQDGLIADGFAFLGQIADARAADESHFAGIGFFHAQNDFHERGFAGAVGADNGHAFAGLDGDRNVVEQFASAK